MRPRTVPVGSVAAPVGASIDLRSLHAFLPLAMADPELGRRYRRLLRRVRETIHPPGMTDVRTAWLDGEEIEVDLGDPAGCELYYGAMPSVVERELFLSLLQPDDVIVDVGAGFGLYALPSGRRVGSGEGGVLAFEPRAGQRRLLEGNLERAGIAGRVSCQAARLGRRPDAPAEVAKRSRSETEAGPDDEDGDAGEATGAGMPDILDHVLPSLGRHGLHALRIAAGADVASVLAGARQLVQQSPDPVVLVEIPSTPADADLLARLTEELTALEQCGFKGYGIDLVGAVETWWHRDGVLVPHLSSILLVRSAGRREAALRELLPVTSARGARLPRVLERSTPRNGSEGHELAPLPLIAALAAARLRELDAVADQLSAQVAAPSIQGAPGTSHSGAPPGLAPASRLEDILALQAEIDRLLRESDVRLQEGRRHRREVKALRARCEVAAGQWIRDRARGARRRLSALFGLRHLPGG